MYSYGATLYMKNGTLTGQLQRKPKTSSIDDEIMKLRLKHNGELRKELKQILKENSEIGEVKMQIKNLIDEDFVQYKKPSMFIGFPKCSFKCDKECGKPVCQNSSLAAAPCVEMDYIEIAKRFYENPITKAIVFGGLEPFDDFEDMISLIKVLNALYITCFDIKEMPDIVIYTGYYPDEIKDKVEELKSAVVDTNIIIKFGRFIPDKPHRFDDILGVELSSDNQYAKKLEDC